MLRELIRASHELSKDAYNDRQEVGEILDTAEQTIFGITKDRLRGGFKPIDGILHETFENLDHIASNPGSVTGVASGLIDLDEITSGFQKGDLAIIAGRPSMGKTALATNIAFNAARKLQESGKKSSIAFFSLEMSSEQLSTRILAEQSRIKSNDIRRGRISEDQFDKFIETSKNISELPLFIDETPAISIAAVSNRARRIKRLFGLDMVLVD